MNLTDTQKQQINREIAKLCGWQIHPRNIGLVIPPNSPNSVQPLHTIPNYTNSLDAMHEAILALPPELRCNFSGRLMDQFGGEAYALHNTINADAARRAIAFLRVMNLEALDQILAGTAA